MTVEQMAHAQRLVLKLDKTLDEQHQILMSLRKDLTEYQEWLLTQIKEERE
jgi:hypothetical protein